MLHGPVRGLGGDRVHAQQRASVQVPDSMLRLRFGGGSPFGECITTAILLTLLGDGRIRKVGEQGDYTFQGWVMRILSHLKNKA